jgi:hypothetical protein
MACRSACSSGAAPTLQREGPRPAGTRRLPTCVRTLSYLLAFDDRSSFWKALLGATEPPSPEIQREVGDAKALIFEAYEQASARGAPLELAVLRA